MRSGTSSYVTSFHSKVMSVTSPSDFQVETFAEHNFYRNDMFPRVHDERRAQASPAHVDEYLSMSGTYDCAVTRRLVSGYATYDGFFVPATIASWEPPRASLRFPVEVRSVVGADHYNLSSRRRKQLSQAFHTFVAENYPLLHPCLCTTFTLERLQQNLGLRSVDILLSHPVPLRGLVSFSNPKLSPRWYDELYAGSAAGNRTLLAFRLEHRDAYVMFEVSGDPLLLKSIEL